MSVAAASAGTASQSSQRAKSSGATNAGMRGWIADSVRLAAVVTMAAVSSSSPLGPVQVSHKPAKASGAAAPGAHKKSLLRSARRTGLPFVKAVGRDQTTPPPDGIAEGRLVEHGFAARIDQKRKGFRLLDPGR